MIRSCSPDDICAYCDEFSVRQADPEQAKIGMGKCLLPREYAVHAAWDATCEAFRPAADAEARRQYVQVQKLNRAEEDLGRPDLAVSDAG